MPTHLATAVLYSGGGRLLLPCRFLSALLVLLLPLPRAWSQANPADKLLGTIPAVVFTPVNSLTFSADGEKVAYLGYSAGEYYRVLNDVILDRVPMVTSGGPFDVVISPDGSRVAYKVEVGSSQAVIVDGKRGPLFEEVGEPVFSDKGADVAYVARSARGSAIVINGQRRATVKDVEIQQFRFSPDGRTVAYSVSTPLGDSHVIAPRLGKGPVFGSVGSLTFSPDGRRLAYWATSGGRQFVTLDHKRIEPAFSPPITFLDPIVFSPDSKSITYHGWRGEKEFYLIAGKEGPAFDEVADFVYSANGKDYAYVAHAAGHAFIVSTVLGNGRSAEHEAAWSPTFGPDGRSLAYCFASGFSDKGGPIPGRTKYGVTVNGVTGPMLDGVDIASIRFSVDGSHVFYGAQIGRELWRKTIVIR